LARGDDDHGDGGRRAAGDRGSGTAAGAPGGNPALTSRAAILAVVVCAIALSLAYPVREYVAQRQQIAELQQRERVARRQVEELTKRKQRLGEESYIMREAARRLHYCPPDVKCYIVLDGGGGEGEQPRQVTAARKAPWYETLWRSVESADRPR
jgi:hypothetical protein